MRNNKPSTTLDSCYSVTINKYSDTLKRLGYDPRSTKGLRMLSGQISLRLCGDLYRLLETEWSETDTLKGPNQVSDKLLFKGEYISQQKLKSGEYNVTFRDSKSKEIKVFKSKKPFDENFVKNYLPGYELFIEYEIAKSRESNKQELYLKENGILKIVGAVSEKNQN